MPSMMKLAPFSRSASSSSSSSLISSLSSPSPCSLSLSRPPCPARLRLPINFHSNRNVRSLTLTTSSLSSHTLSSSPSSSSSSLSRMHARTMSSQPSSSSTLGLGPNGGRLVEFNLADIGEGIAECEILRWFVSEGAPIAQFDKVCEVQSDKANVEITSRYDGIIRSLAYPQGALAKVGKPLMVIELAPSTAPASTPSSSTTPTTTAAADVAPHSDSHSSSSSSSSSSDRFLTSPSVRRLVREHNVNLSAVPATGPNGRHLKEDVQAYIDARAAGKQLPTATTAKASTPPPIAPTPTPAPPVSKPAPKSPASASASTSSPSSSSSPSPPSSSPSYLAADTVVPVTGIQRIMVSTMVAASSVPTFGFSDEIVMDELVAVREQLKGVASKQGIKLSFLPFIIKAVSLSLRSYPSLNAHVASDCTSVTWRAAHNIGIAMDTPRGLLVPNIKHCERKSIIEIAAELNRLAELGQQGKLGKDDLTGGTFSLSNIGSVGGTYMRPILVVPEIVIGALGGIKVVPRYASTPVHGQPAPAIVPSSIMAVSWSGDHRVLDGATVARFSMLFKSYIEKPNTFILDTR